MEIALIVGIALIIFGPKRLPELGRGVGGGMREFKQSITGREALAAETETETTKDASSI
jgi:sec-independent protein translocase protein TatA